MKSEVFKNAMIQQYKTDIGFRTLVESVNDNMYVIPKYQRKYRWDKNRLVALVDSLLNGLPIPPIYTCRNKENQLEILDGQQRVMSLFFYYIGYFLKVGKNSAVDFSALEMLQEPFSDVLFKNLSMEKLHINLKDTQGNEVNVDYANLPIELRRKVDYTTITVIEIQIDPEENREAVLRKIFSNLNKGGKLLSDQEQRNGIYNCAFYEMLQRFNSNNSKWRNIWGREHPAAKDMEVLLRFCTLRKYAGYNSLMKEFFIKNYHSSYVDLLDTFSEEAMAFSEEETAEYEKELEEFMNLFFIHRKMSSNITLLESFYAIFTVFDKKIPITQDVCDKVLEDNRYKENTRQGTANMRKINERWKTLYDIWCDNDNAGGTGNYQ